MTKALHRFSREDVERLIAEHGSHEKAAAAAGIGRSTFSKIAAIYWVKSAPPNSLKHGNDAWKELGR